MKTLHSLLLLLSFLFACRQEESLQTKRPVDYVNPFISTQDDHGHWHPSALVPFGTVKLGPDSYPGTALDGDFAHSGYNYADTQVRGFSHFHLGGFGGTQISNRSGYFSIFPFVAERKGLTLSLLISDVDKKQERASAGYYSTFMEGDNIRVECTATTRSGHMLLHYPAGSEAKIIVYEGNRSSNAPVNCKKVDDYTLEGSVTSGGAEFFFVTKFNKPIVSTLVYDDRCEPASQTEMNGVINGGYICHFGDLKGEPLYIQSGISLTSADGARDNFKAECLNTTFAAVKERASNTWNDIISRMTVSGGTEENKHIFYTALYHNCFLPTNFSDVNGDYLGFDKKVYKNEGFTQYSGYAFWDEIRGKSVLMSLLTPEVYSQMCYSLKSIYEKAVFETKTNRNPHGPGAGYRFYGLNGYVWGDCRYEHMLMALSDAYAKKIPAPALEEVYPYMRKEALAQMSEEYDKIGYIPARFDETCEYSWDNYCMALMAKRLGKEDDYNYFLKRSNYWRNTWDHSIQFFRARAAEGHFLDFPNDPAENREKYAYEGSKWHLRWSVLHDVPSLIEYFGGDAAFNKALIYFFENDLYTAGNQIDLHTPWLFNFSGAPWLSQKWAHKIATEPIIQKYGTHGFFPEPILGRVYRNEPEGMLEEMDDDFGCMSGWFGLAAIGLFQMCPGDPVYQLSSPIFNRIEIKVENNKTFTIEAKNYSKDNYYIQSAVLNGQPYTKCSITHAQLMEGGKLELVMGNIPNKSWGVE